MPEHPASTSSLLKLPQGQASALAVGPCSQSEQAGSGRTQTSAKGSPPKRDEMYIELKRCSNSAEASVRGILTCGKDRGRPRPRRSFPTPLNETIPIPVWDERSMATDTFLGRAAADWLANRLEGAALLRLLNQHTAALEQLFRGFKVGAKNVDKRTIRARLRSLIERDPEFRQAFLAFPGAPWTTWAQALLALSEEWLLRHWRTLARGAEGRELLVALALQERPALRRRGERALRTEHPWSPETAPKVSDSDVFPAEWLLLHDLMDNGREPTTSSPPASGGEETARIERELRVATKDLGHSRERLRRLKEQHAKVEATFQAERDLLQDQLRSTRREAREAREARDELTAELGARVERQVATFRCHSLGMTSELDLVREKLELGHDDDILARVRKVLAAQADLNERHGLLSQLRKRVTDLAVAEDELVRALEESVVVLPELKGTLERVRQERTELEKQLPESRPRDVESPFAALLLAQVGEALHNADGLARLDDVGSVLRAPFVLRTLRKGESELITEALEERRQGIAERMSSVEERGISPEVDADTVHHAVEIWHVGDVLESGRTAGLPWLFIDGYNVVKRVHALSRIEHGEGLAAARDSLVASCRSVAQRFGRLEVVFDGRGTVPSRETSDGVTVVFTAQTHDSQNADRYIMRQLGEVRDDTDALWLVTDDYGLRYHAEALADAFLPTDRFYHFLRVNRDS